MNVWTPPEAMRYYIHQKSQIKFSQVYLLSTYSETNKPKAEEPTDSAIWSPPNSSSMYVHTSIDNRQQCIMYIQSHPTPLHNLSVLKAR